jgi:hypothetical protein
MCTVGGAVLFMINNNKRILPVIMDKTSNFTGNNG